jgi:hypothetical protein
MSTPELSLPSIPADIASLLEHARTLRMNAQGPLTYDGRTVGMVNLIDEHTQE